MNSSTARDAIEHVRRRWRERRPGLPPISRLGIGLLACFAAAVLGIAAYLVGASSGVDASAAEGIRRLAYQTTFEQARADAAARAKPRGRQAGRRAGRRAGARAGQRAGAQRGSMAAQRLQAAIAEQQAIEAAAAAARPKGKAEGPAPEPAPTLAPEPAPAIAPAPAPEPEPEPAPTPTAPAPEPEPPCFDAAGHPC